MDPSSLSRGYAADALDFFLGQAIPGKSLQDQRPHESGQLARRNFKAFSAFEHALLVVLGLCKGFGGAENLAEIGRALVEALKPGSAFVAHFSQFYSKVG